MKKLTKEEIGYKTTDKIRQMWLLNPHDHHFLYVRDDGSFYGFTHMKGEDPEEWFWDCLLYTSPSPRDVEESRMPSSA